MRWQAERCIVALPVFIAARVVENPPELLRQAAAHLRYAPWLVANVHLRAPLADRPGAAPSWDNVIYGTRGLGYVDARHQALDPTPGATVLSWYRPLGPSAYDGAGRPPPAARSAMDGLARRLAGGALAAASGPARLATPHRDHALRPRDGDPGARACCGRLARARRAIGAGRLAFAHSDWSGYSIFEEAFTRGHLAI